jgi:hypothetical protein
MTEPAPLPEHVETEAERQSRLAGEAEASPRRGLRSLPVFMSMLTTSMRGSTALAPITNCRRRPRAIVDRVACRAG